jgi:hypothetical protein
MKLARLLGLVILLAGTLSAVLANSDEGGETKEKWVKVNKQLVNIRKDLDPTSEVIYHAKKNEYLELVAEGIQGSWNRVRVNVIDDSGNVQVKVGHLEARHGTIVDRKGVPAVMILLYIILLLGCAGGVVLYVKKQQSAASSDSDSDPDYD